MIDTYKILEIRELSGLSQDDFARYIGYSREVVNKVEKGRMKPSKWFVQAVQKYVSEHQIADFSQDVNILGKASPNVNKRSSTPYISSRLHHKNEASSFMVPLIGIKAQAGYVKG